MNSKSMAGWIGFAAIVLLIVGAIDFFQGLIARVRGRVLRTHWVWLPRLRSDGPGAGR